MRQRSLSLVVVSLVVQAGLLLGSGAALPSPSPRPAVASAPTEGQEARRRWEVMAQIRRDKFDYILPEVMRENEIDMWITVMREGLHDPLYDDLGRGYVGGIGYYVFSDRGGERIERAALGISGYLLRKTAPTTSSPGASTCANSSPSATRGASA